MFICKTWIQLKSGNFWSDFKDCATLDRAVRYGEAFKAAFNPETDIVRDYEVYRRAGSAPIRLYDLWLISSVPIYVMIPATGDTLYYDGLDRHDDTVIDIDIHHFNNNPAIVVITAESATKGE